MIENINEKLKYRNKEPACVFLTVWSDCTEKMGRLQRLAISKIRKPKQEASAYGGPQVQSEFQLTALLRILEPHTEFLNPTPNSKISLRVVESHSEFFNLTLNSWTSFRIHEPHSAFNWPCVRSFPINRALHFISVFMRQYVMGMDACTSSFTTSS